MGEVRGFPAGLWAKVGWGDRSWCCKLKEPGIGVPGLELLIQERIIVLQCLVTVVIRKWTVGRKDRGVVVSVSADPLLPSVGMDCHLESDMSPTGLCFTYLFYSWMLWNPQEEGPDGGSRSLGWVLGIIVAPGSCQPLSASRFVVRWTGPVTLSCHHDLSFARPSQCHGKQNLWYGEQK